MEPREFVPLRRGSRTSDADGRASARSTRAALPRPATTWPAAVVLGAFAAGCAAQRELVITSEPSGALVRLDDTVVGTTPYTTTFDAYGKRRVTLYLEGYRPRTQVFEMKPPWFAYFPIDVFSEVLFPFGWHDRHEVPLTLERESGAVTTPDLEAVLERAQALRYAEPTGPRPARVKPTPESTPAPPAPETTLPPNAPDTEPRRAPRTDGGPRSDSTPPHHETQR